MQTAKNPDKAAHNELPHLDSLLFADSNTSVLGALRVKDG